MAAHSNPDLASTLGKGDKGGRAKAEAAARKAQENNEMAEVTVPVNAEGRPLTKITVSASELIPTGQYANVSIGPVQVQTYVDLDRTPEVDDDGKMSFFTDEERSTMAMALNELAEVVEVDVVGVQRNLVLESLQKQNEQDK